MDNEKKDAAHAALLSLILTTLPWIVLSANGFFALRLQHFGLYPRHWGGLGGILTMPLLHEGADHLIANTPSLFLLIFGLFLMYGKTSWRILAHLYLLTGLLTWLMGRPDTLHIGASGLAYALAAFHFTAGLVRKEPRRMAFALVVAFLYGGFVWAFFPSLYKHTTLSWEGHLSGLLTGITFAIYYRRAGPEPPADPFLIDDAADEPDENGLSYWNPPEEEKDSAIQ
jgi:membrane associated rhomboid family serine protease